MTAAQLTFACPTCARRIGIGSEWAGRQVRCPHCRAVVTAPLTSDAAPVSPPVQQPSFENPFGSGRPGPQVTQQREGQDSIF
ncbi:MAG: hypothetical protein ACRC7O_00210, partial [Fimbriiglobus sp.]